MTKAQPGGTERRRQALHKLWRRTAITKGNDMSTWDDPALKLAGDFVQFEEIGDVIDGVVTVVKSHTFPAEGDKPPRTKPQIFLKLSTCTRQPELTDGRESCLTPGAHLHALLSTLRPEAGDRLWAKYVRNEKVPGKPAPKKVFEARVARGAAPAPAAAKPVDDTPPF